MTVRPHFSPLADGWCRRWRILGLLLAFATGLAAAPTEADQVIVPGAAGAKPAAGPAGSPGAGAFTLAAVVLLAGAGAWVLWRGRGRKLPSFGRGTRQLNVDETRALGGRQYLVVASYRDRKFLLGVCPGRIEMLARLDEAGAPAEERIS